MSRRFRFVAALMALVAFSVYFTEGVLAAFCAPDSGAHAEVVLDAGSAPDDCCAEAHEGSSQHDPSDGAHRTDCPLGMGGGATCAAASLPATAVAVQPVPAGSEASYGPQQVNVRFLLIHTLYHPPRA